MTRAVEALRHASEQLASSGSDAPLLEARILVETVLDRPRVWVYQHPEAMLDDAQSRQLQDMVARRRDGEPLAYLLGTREFYGRSFEVDPRVLVPRPETETLLEHALAFAGSRRGEGTTSPPALPGAGREPDARPLRILDVGTGCGILGISLALELPSARVVMIDRSAEALAVAAENCRRHGLDRRVSLIQGDLVGGVVGPVDLIVANLPYIPSNEIAELQPEVRREPRAALDGGPDGLDLYRRLFSQAPSLLSPQGGLFAEIGDGQGASAAAAARQRFPSRDVRVHPDLAGRDRVIAVTPRLE